MRGIRKGYALAPRLDVALNLDGAGVRKDGNDQLVSRRRSVRLAASAAQMRSLATLIYSVQRRNFREYGGGDRCASPSTAARSSWSLCGAGWDRAGRVNWIEDYADASFNAVVIFSSNSSMSNGLSTTDTIISANRPANSSTSRTAPVQRTMGIRVVLGDALSI